MKKSNRTTLYGLDKILCGIAGAIIGFLVGGILIGFLLAGAGVVVGHLLEKDLEKIKI